MGLKGVMVIKALLPFGDALLLSKQTLSWFEVLVISETCSLQMKKNQKTAQKQLMPSTSNAVVKNCLKILIQYLLSN